ncbi:hypothetical protein ACFQQB_64660 [Nonomuraea rubra]
MLVRRGVECVRSPAAWDGPSAISRELARNVAIRNGRLDYRASIAQWHAGRRARPEACKLAADDRLLRLQDRLASAVRFSDGYEIEGSQVRRSARRHGHRQERRWATSWSAEQIVGRLPDGFSEDETMRISNETIYQARMSGAVACCGAN